MRHGSPEVSLIPPVPSMSSIRAVSSGRMSQCTRCRLQSGALSHARPPRPLSAAVVIGRGQIDLTLRGTRLLYTTAWAAKQDSKPTARPPTDPVDENDADRSPQNLSNVGGFEKLETRVKACRSTPWSVQTKIKSASSPLRALLYVPGSSVKMLKKALAKSASSSTVKRSFDVPDALILDLEVRLEPCLGDRLDADMSRPFRTLWRRGKKEKPGGTFSSKSRAVGTFGSQEPAS